MGTGQKALLVSRKLATIAILGPCPNHPYYSASRGVKGGAARFRTEHCPKSRVAYALRSIPHVYKEQEILDGYGHLALHGHLRPLHGCGWRSQRAAAQLVSRPRRKRRGQARWPQHLRQ